MKNSIDFLPERKQRDLHELAALIRDEVKDVVMIILYGSYAANTYVERDERRDYGVPDNLHEQTTTICWSLPSVGWENRKAR
ncbi:MAG: hypothetical protein ACLUQ6_00635 [Alistipes onderdonkii]